MKGIFSSTLVMLAIVGGASSSVRPALAQPTAHDRADALFRQGKSLLEQGRYAEACAMLSESFGLDPATGTLLALALCHEGAGKLATASTEFEQVAQDSEKAGRTDRAALAREHQAALTPLLSHLTLGVPVSVVVPGLVIRVDGHAVPQHSWNKAIPIDPGPHTIEALAPGKRRWSASIEVGQTADAKAVDVPQLEDDLAVAAEPVNGDAAALQPARAGGSAKAEPTLTRQAGSKSPLPLVLLGGGVAGIGVGSFFGLRAISDSNAAKTACPTSPCNDSNALRTNNDARTEAWVADVAIGAGAIAAAVGLYLLIRSPDAGASPVSVSGLAVDAHGATVRVRW
jgi:hypothetical protein